MRRLGSIIRSGMFLILTLLALLGGCIQTRPHLGANAAQNITGVLDHKTGAGPLTQAQLQALVMNSADIYVMSAWQAFDEIRRSTTDPLTRAQAQYLKVLLSANATAIATGRNAAVNLLDMLVFVSLGRYAVENYWEPKVFGTHGTVLIKTYCKLEKEIWKTSSSVLTGAQQKTLRNLIRQGIAANPDQYYTAAIRLSDFAEMQGGGNRQPGGSRHPAGRRGERGGRGGRRAAPLRARHVPCRTPASHDDHADGAGAGPGGGSTRCCAVADQL